MFSNIFSLTPWSQEVMRDHQSARLHRTTASTVAGTCCSEDSAVPHLEHLRFLHHDLPMSAGY